MEAAVGAADALEVADCLAHGLQLGAFAQALGMERIAIALLERDQFRGRSPKRVRKSIARGLARGPDGPDLLEGVGDLRPQQGFVLLMAGQRGPMIVEDGLPFEVSEMPPFGQQAG